MKKGLILLISLLLISTALATTPNPGHSAAEIGGTTASERIFNSTGNYAFRGGLGVGILNPSHLLNVNGSANITGDVYLGTANGAVMFIDDTNNRVGIGTTSPAALSVLDIKSSSSSTNPFRITQSSSSNLLFRIQEGSAGEANLILHNSAGSNAVVLRSEGISEFLGGNVGIGTSTPSTKLDVVGTINGVGFTEGGSNTLSNDISGNAATATTATTASELACTDCVDGSDLADSITLDADLNIDANTLYIDRGNNRVGIGTSTPSGRLEIKSVGTNTNVFRIESSASSNQVFRVLEGANNEGQVAIANKTGGNGVVLRGTGISEFLGGNVGIGTSTPSTKLDVVGTINGVGFTEGGSNTLSNDISGNAATATTATTASELACTDCVDGSDLADSITLDADLNIDANTLYIDIANNRVGIGTSAPTALLEIESSNPSLLLDDTTPSGITGLDVSGDNFITFQNQDGTADTRSGIRARGFGNQYLASIDFVQSSGTGPDGEIVFATTTSGNAGITEAMRIDKDGNVGIGVSAPESEFQVKGVIQNGVTGNFDTFHATLNADTTAGSPTKLFTGGGTDTVCQISVKASGYTANNKRFSSHWDTGYIYRNGLLKAPIVAVADYDPSSIADIYWDSALNVLWFNNTEGTSSLFAVAYVQATCRVANPTFG